MATVGEAIDAALKHHQAGRLREAETIYRQILSIEPQNVAAWHLLGRLAQQAGRNDAAIEFIGRAVALLPGYAAGYLDLGSVFHVQKRFEEAATCYRTALRLNPEYLEAHNNLGFVYKDLGQPDSAEACHRQALALKSDDSVAYEGLGNAYKERARCGEAMASYRRAAALRPNVTSAHDNLVYALHFCSAYDSGTIYEEHRRWNDQHAAPLAQFIRPHTNERSPARRLKIGYVSPDFCNHVQVLFTVPLLAAHDHEQFEIVCYSSTARREAFTVRVRESADVWRDVTGMTDERVAELIRDDEIDILVDLTMHMPNNRLLMFARKPAPVQVAWLAYPGTTGLTTIDYRLTDPYLDPPGMFDPCYSEESIRLPDSFWCFDPLVGEPAVNGLPALKNGRVTFGSLNNFCKVNASTLKLWARVLRAVERSRLVLLAPEGSSRQWVHEVFQAEGVAEERIRFVARQARLAYLRVYHRIDIGLDTWPYNGHTTSLDALWMGVPVVTQVGQTVVGRAGLSQCSNLGLTELVGESPDDFVRIAAELAGDLDRLSELRATLRGRMERSPLMDAPRFARNMEAAYRAMWRRWCGAAPQSGVT